MSEFKGTKGKWNVSKETNINNFGVEYFTIDFETSIECIDVYVDYRLSEEEKIINGKANALLISKAPEMLEMLKLFTDFPDEDFKENESNNYYTFSVKISDMIKAKQLIKEATEL